MQTTHASGTAEREAALTMAGGGLRKTRFIGLAKVRAQTTFTFAAYNLTRLATIFGWRLSVV